MPKTFLDQIGSVAFFISPSGLPGCRDNLYLQEARQASNNFVNDFAATAFSSMTTAGVLPEGLLPRCSERQREDAFSPSGPVEFHFHGVLVPGKTLGRGAVETFNNGLVAVNVNPPASSKCFVIFHLFCNRARDQPAAFEATSEAHACKSSEWPGRLH